jgi:hypothetical protein
MASSRASALAVSVLAPAIEAIEAALMLLRKDRRSISHTSFGDENW